MPSKVPLASTLNWPIFGLQILIVGSFIAIAVGRNDRKWIFFGAIAYALVRQLLVWTLSSDHREAIRAVKRAEFHRAISCFQKSYDHFDKHRWLDRYRALFLLSASSITFREMALVNIAFCHGQLGDGKACRIGYERALAEFPDSVIARTALNMINATEQARAM